MLKTVLLAGAAICCAVPSLAANIAAFSQTSGSNTVTATVNGADTVTTLSIVDATVLLGQFLGGVPGFPVFLDLNAASVDAATTLGAAAIQHYSGTFCITSGTGCGGTNVLSGTFSDAAFGALGGPGLVVNVNNPPDALTLTSDILPAAELDPPSAFGLTFTNLSPALALVGMAGAETIAPFTASFAGTVSASAAAIPEPASLALLGLGVLGLAAVRRRG